MAFFNEVSKKITQTGQETVQKAKNTTEAIRLNGQINDERKRIDAELLQIGRIYYDTRNMQPEPPFAEHIENINAANARIAEYARQVAQLKSSVRCPVCGYECPYGMSICGSCGSMTGGSDNVKSAPVDTSSPVPAPVTMTVGTNITCSSCGEPVSPGKAFCRHCGNKVEQPATPVQLARDLESPIQDASEPSAPPPPACCNACGAELEENASFCMICGAKADATNTD